MTDYWRKPFEHERFTDFAAQDDTHTAGLVAAVAALAVLRRRQLAAIDRGGRVESGDHRRLTARMRAIARRAARQAALEARRQRVEATTPELTTADDRKIDSAAKAAAVAAAAALIRARQRKASRSELERVGLKDAARLATGRSIGVGRLRVMQTFEPTELFASELLDARTCAECQAVDGRSYTSLEDAEADYPDGSYVSCRGGHRCRGTIIAIYRVEQEVAA